MNLFYGTEMQGRVCTREVIAAVAKERLLSRFWL